MLLTLLFLPRNHLVGALIMTHADDDGLVLPPKLAPCHVVILPIYRDDAQRGEVMEYVETLKQELSALHFSGGSVRVEIRAWTFASLGPRSEEASSGPVEVQLCSATACLAPLVLQGLAAGKEVAAHGVREVPTSFDLFAVRVGMAVQVLLAWRYCSGRALPLILAGYTAGGACYACGRILTVRGAVLAGHRVHCGVHVFANLGNLLILPYVV